MAAYRGEARAEISPMIATLPTDLFRHQVFLARTPQARSRRVAAWMWRCPRPGNDVALPATWERSK